MTLHAESINARIGRNKVEMSPFKLVTSALTDFAEKYDGAYGVHDGVCFYPADVWSPRCACAELEVKWYP